MQGHLRGQDSQVGRYLLQALGACRHQEVSSELLDACLPACVRRTAVDLVGWLVDGLMG